MPTTRRSLHDQEDCAQAKDVDADGKDDTFVCADRDTDDDGLPDFEDHHDDSGADPGDDNGSGTDTGSGSGTDSGGTGWMGHEHHHDGDANDVDDDGVSNDHDCGNGDQPAPPSA